MYFDMSPPDPQDAYAWFREGSITAVGGHLEMEDLRFLEAFIRSLKATPRVQRKILKAGGELLLALSHDRMGNSPMNWVDQDRYLWIAQKQDHRPYFRCDHDIGDVWSDKDVAQRMKLFFSVPTSNYKAGRKVAVGSMQVLVLDGEDPGKDWEVCIQSVPSSNLVITIESKTPKVDPWEAAESVQDLLGELGHATTQSTTPWARAILQGHDSKPKGKILRLLEAHVLQKLRA